MNTLQEKLRTAKLDEMNIRDAIDDFSALRDELAKHFESVKVPEELYSLHKSTRHSLQVLKNYCTKMTKERKEHIRESYSKERDTEE